MEAIEFLGITFRSQQHLGWFITTMGIFVPFFIAFVAYLLPKKHYFDAIWIWTLLAAISAAVWHKAKIETQDGAVNGPLFSADCIWYNRTLAAFALACALLSFFLRWRARKHAQ